MRATDLDAGWLGRRSPPNAWEAYFVIGVFPEGSALHWCKLHLFSGGARPGRHCLSAAEAIDGPPERLLLRATQGRVDVDRRPLAPGELVRADSSWGVRADGLQWSGGFPDLALALDEPHVRATMRPRDVLVWARFPRVLSYWSGFGPLSWDGPEGRVEGLGVVEHAWGADTKLDVARLAPGRWQWDVLAVDDGSFAAGLAIAPIGSRMLAVRSGGDVGGSFRYGGGLRVDILEWRDEEKRRVPARWRGTIALGDEAIHYEARATTPVAPMVPDGGFVGFAFEGEWRARGATRPLKGSGFSEYRAR